MTQEQKDLILNATIKVLTVNEHISMEKAKEISLYDAISAPGFQKIVKKQVPEADNEFVALIQSIQVVE